MIVSLFEGSLYGYVIAGVIGFFACPLLILFSIALTSLIDKIQAYIAYCKKRRHVVEKLYPQYEELMKGEIND